MTKKLTWTAAKIVLIFGCGCLISNPVSAATFEFSYQFSSGEKLTGTLEGDLTADGEKAKNLSSLNVTYSGDVDLVFDQFSPGETNLFNLDSSSVFILGKSTTADASFSLIRGTNGTSWAYVLDSESNSFLETEEFATERFTLTNTPTTTPTPEPETTATLVLLGSLWFGCHRKSKLR